MKYYIDQINSDFCLNNHINIKNTKTLLWTCELNEFFVTRIINLDAMEIVNF